MESFGQLKAWIKTGVSPRGAQVRRTGGRCETPLSSWKTIQARRRRAFFYRRPARGDPVADGRLVALPGAGRGPLQGPVEGPQDAPHVAGVVPHARDAVDHPRDPRQRPQVRGEAKGAGPLPQGRLDPRQLPGLQAGLAPGPPAGPQGAPSAPAPRAIPPQHTLATDREASGDRRLRLRARGEQSGRPLPPNLQRMEITSRGNMCVHTSILRQRRQIVTLLCEIQ